MFSTILSKLFHDRRALRRARMKRLRTSNSVLIIFLIVVLPIYPVFGSILYDGSRRGGVGIGLDEASILAEYTDVTDA